MSAIAIALVAAVLVAASALAASRAYRRGDVLPGPVVALVWVAYLTLLAAVAYSTLARTWRLPLPTWLGFPLGGILMLPGVALVAGGIARMDSSAQMSGRDVGTLATSGAYRLSRNPQNVGLALFMFGLAIAARSGLTLALALVAGAAFHLYLPAEEAHLERVFGEAYRRYRESTPRYLGRVGRTRPSDGP